MLRHSALTCGHNTVLRFYAEPTDDPFADYVGVATVGWESATVIWLEAMHGDLTWEHWHDIADWLKEMGVHTIKAHRAPGRRLPLARTVGDHEEMDVARLVRRFARSRLTPV